MKCSAGYFFFIAAVLCSHSSFSQYKSYSLNAKKDTINRIDLNDQKQGYWFVRVENNHGEPSYQEEGYYKDNKKAGAWKRYNLMGDVLAEENYKWGYKDGICRYYNLMGLIREESWRAIDPLNPYDTVRVYHLDDPDRYDLKIIKVDASSVKHGTWTYYDPQRGTISKTEEYVIDQLVTNKKSNNAGDSTALRKGSSDSTSFTNKTKPPEVLEYEKKNSNKKKIKVRDGATGL
jgi:hypothetical protein